MSDDEFLEQARIYTGRLWKRQQKDELRSALNAAKQAMIQMGIALRPAFEQTRMIALSPAFQELALEVAVRYEYVDDICEPEEDVFV